MKRRLALLLATTVGVACVCRVHAEAPCRIANVERSELRFIGVQAGAPFAGQFKTFGAEICFAPDQLATSRFAVDIQTASADTQDADRDEVLRSADLFDVTRWPTAHYEAHSFRQQGNGHSADGTLTLRGISRPVSTVFRFEENPDGGTTVTGSAELERLDFGVGQGEWRDTTWVANAVKIEYRLMLRPGSAQ